MKHAKCVRLAGGFYAQTGLHLPGKREPHLVNARTHPTVFEHQPLSSHGPRQTPSGAYNSDKQMKMVRCKN